VVEREEVDSNLDSLALQRFTVVVAEVEIDLLEVLPV
jgi:glycerol-3-phosphate responsive antiterminator